MSDGLCPHGLPTGPVKGICPACRLSEAELPQTPEEAEAALEAMATAADPANFDKPLPKPGVPSDELYRILLEQIPAVTFRTSFEGAEQNDIYVSPQIEAILGYTPQEWLASPSLWYERLHPDDRERWEKEFSDTVMTKGTSVRSTYRFLHRDGRTVWILGDVRIKRDANGFPLFVQAVGFDVTKEEEAREAQRREKERELAEKQREIVHLRAEMQDEGALEQLVGSSKPMKRIRELIRRVAGSQSTVMILGESGTGKELAARAIHYKSARARKPLVEVNSAAFSETLQDSELFGHEKGAFTGATERRIGKFEQADGGTLFLDEIGDMHPNVQAKILRVLQERKLQRLGGKDTIPVDVRVICATNRELTELIKAGRFREDLYYRLNVVRVALPPLRDRRGDVPELAECFLARKNREEKRQLRLSEAALELLCAHAWPGNVRELKHAIEGAVVLCDGDEIQPEDLPPELLSSDAQPAAAPGRERFSDYVQRMKREGILLALREAKGDRTKAARALGLSFRSLEYQLKNLSIDPRRLDPEAGDTGTDA